MARLSLSLAAAFLLTLALADTSPEKAHLYFTTVALHWVMLLTLAAWLGGALYLAFVFVPVTHVIESGERAQTLVELLPTIKPSITQAFTGISLYAIFSVETHMGASTPLRMIGTPYDWIIIATAGLSVVAVLLTYYQNHRLLPRLARIAWLAARGTFMGVLGGIDVSRSLQIGQSERQGLAELAARRFRYILHAQMVVGLLILLGFVLASAFVPSLAI